MLLRKHPAARPILNVVALLEKIQAMLERHKVMYASNSSSICCACCSFGSSLLAAAQAATADRGHQNFQQWAS